MTTVQKSFVTFTRRTLAVKGGTEFTGRGWYFMEMRCNWQFLTARAQVMVERLRQMGALERATITADAIEIRGDRETFGSYNHFAAKRADLLNGEMAGGVHMTFEDECDCKYGGDSLPTYVCDKHAAK